MLCHMEHVYGFVVTPLQSLWAVIRHCTSDIRACQHAVDEAPDGVITTECAEMGVELGPFLGWPLRQRLVLPALAARGRCVGKARRRPWPQDGPQD